VLVYTGGDYETHRPSREAGGVDFDHRQGFIEMALERGLPIVPVVSIGGQETALFLTRKCVGSRPSLDDAHDHVVGVMQRALDDLAAERRLPIVG